MLKSNLCTKLIKDFFSAFNFNFLKPRKMSPTVFVKQLEHENTMQISFMFRYSNFPEQNFTFMRLKDERLDLALVRMKNKIQSNVLQKAAKKKKKFPDFIDEVLPPLNIVLMQNGSKVADNSKNIDAWTPDTKVIIDDETYNVLVNPPVVINISLPKYIMSGMLVYPKVSLEFCSREECLFKWYRQINKSNKSMQDSDTVIKIKNECWSFLSEGFLYTAKECDVGCKLRVSCVPQSQDKSGYEVSALSANVVCSSKYPFEDRHHHTKDLTGVGR